ELERGEDGYWSGTLPGAGIGHRYGFLLDDDPKPYPDPASRFQPDGPHGLSALVDPSTFQWDDEAWHGVPEDGRVVYEMHIGTFTPEGTWAAAAARLPALAELGVSVLEVMPVSEFSGAFGWGYDGVDLYAPTRLYGTPDDMRHFVRRAHALGLGVILDVVYNHFGPDGNYHEQYAKAYFTDRYENEWGKPLNFDGPDSGPVREFFITNARYWIEEFRLDGLRLDATQQIFDASPRHILAEITQAVRRAGKGRRTYVVGENEPQDTTLVRPPAEGGFGLDALWNDDFHHSAMVALTGRSEAYYSDYGGTAQEFVSAAKYGFLYQGQFYGWQKQGRGSATFDLPPRCFVTFFQNHDQVANSATGQRIHQLASPGDFRAMTAFWLLAPGTPMLFQGQEWGASSPFHYFADHEPGLAEAVAHGRKEFLEQFNSIATPEMRERLPHPAARETFEACKLDHGERERDEHARILALHRDLLKLRRDDPALCHQGKDRRMDGAVLSGEAFGLRFFGPRPRQDRLLLVNLDRDLRLEPMPEPLLAPPAGCAWEMLWTSEDPRYGGAGSPPPPPDAPWMLPGRTALLLAPSENHEK
ncbi:MAG TPA: malto-oligosyltrehalose trehalohydrolase, partial [Arenibaculum sp.]|nr:malto-oligosyltrehalose trehalohydrolase [Arenibaculum sp.]